MWGDVSKLRRPYVIRKSREKWTAEEHDRFVEALTLYGRDWKLVTEQVGSKTRIQVRSHAQKYFIRLEKEHAASKPPENTLSSTGPRSASFGTSTSSSDIDETVSASRRSHSVPQPPMDVADDLIHVLVDVPAAHITSDEDDQLNCDRSTPVENLLFGLDASSSRLPIDLANFSEEDANMDALFDDDLTQDMFAFEVEDAVDGSSICTF
mmetsp:Transcript_3164/g.9655  ORF Transcript_3164/g.9655 Transcript_3164/m.9655 type:complete len:209 (+) Transcript_3164:486-1112(+)